MYRTRIYLIILLTLGFSTSCVKEVGDKSEAKVWLKLAKERCMQGSVESEIGYAREYLKKADLSFSDIGTSTQEIDSLLTLGFRSEANSWFQRAKTRCSQGNVEDEIGYFQKYLKKADMNLGNMGVSQKGIDSLVLEGYESEAKHWLRLARERCKKETVEDEIGYLYDYLVKASLTLKDIGVTEQSITTTLSEGYKAEAVRLLKKAQEKKSSGCVKFEIEYIFELLTKGNLKPEEIGSSQDELKTILLEGYKSGAIDCLMRAREAKRKGERLIFIHADVCRIYLEWGNFRPEDIGTTEAELDSLGRVKS